MYKVLYIPKSGTNIVISCSSSNWFKIGLRKARKGTWEIHLGKLHISYYKPLNPKEK